MNSGWFHLARYFDPDWERRGPAALAAALHRSVSDAFPIRYDLTAVAMGVAVSLSGRSWRSPRSELNGPSE
jgi:hypothetical protein